MCFFFLFSLSDSSRIKLPSAMLTTLSQFCTQAPNKNTGETFLVIWKESEDSGANEVVATDLVDLAVVSVPRNRSFFFRSTSTVACNLRPESNQTQLCSHCSMFLTHFIQLVHYICIKCKDSFPQVDNCHPIPRMILPSLARTGKRGAYGEVCGRCPAVDVYFP